MVDGQPTQTRGARGMGRVCAGKGVRSRHLGRHAEAPRCESRPRRPKCREGQAAAPGRRRTAAQCRTLGVVLLGRSAAPRAPPAQAVALRCMRRARCACLPSLRSAGADRAETDRGLGGSDGELSSMRRRHEGEERAQSTRHSKRRRERARKWRAAASAASMRRNGRWQAAARFAAVASLRAVATAKAQAASRRSTLRPLSCAPRAFDVDSSRRAREGTGCREPLR